MAQEPTAAACWSPSHRWPWLRCVLTTEWRRGSLTGFAGLLAGAGARVVAAPPAASVLAGRFPVPDVSRIGDPVREKEITMMTVESGPAPADAPVADLVIRARGGERRAWDAIVERYAPLVWSICRRYRLSAADADDAGQAVWLQLVDQIGRIRDPAALPGWLATTTRRECGRLVRASQRTQPPGYVLDAENIPDSQAATADDELLLAERHAALREALAHLPASCRDLIALLAADPPLPYAQISARLGIPVGSIGPSRSRCLDKLRRYPAVAALIDAEASAA